MGARQVIQRILEQKRIEVARRQEARPPEEVMAAALSAPAPRAFASALRGDGIQLIAEIKRASPARGDLWPDLDPASLARAYHGGGAAALSVLTDERFFRGSDLDLVQARAAVDLPVLRKDFVVSEYQVFEARGLGADAVLLIVRALTSRELRHLLGVADGLGMAALVEVHSESELEVAVEAGARLVGINNRDLDTMQVDVETTFRLLPLVPPGLTVVSESGIHSRDTVRRLEEAGVHAILVGEALVTSDDPAGKVAELRGVKG